MTAMNRKDNIMKDYLGIDKEIHFLFPVDGDCLNEYDGELLQNEPVTEATEDHASVCAGSAADYLLVTVKVAAPADRQLTVNKVPLAWQGDHYEAKVPVAGYRTSLVIQDLQDLNVNEKIVVFRLPHATGGYRLSSDDNILFLQDINDHKDEYTSIFDNPYLAMYKGAHDKYGAKVQLNIHYETDENKGFAIPREYFNLTMMTDKFKDEWAANADWLRLSFHARRVSKDKPYIATDMNEITRDAQLVYNEVLRFAGPATLCKENTTIHWGECTQEGMRGMRNIGLNGAFGYFDILESGETTVSYFYPVDFVHYLHERDYWWDTDEDILYGKIDLVLNCYPLEEIVPELEKIYANPHQSGFIEIMIHEQYFYEDYEAYIKEFSEIVHTACKWCMEHGYEGRYLAEVRNP